MDNVIIKRAMFREDNKTANVAVIKEVDEKAKTVTVDLFSRIRNGEPDHLTHENKVFKYRGKGKDCPFPFEDPDTNTNETND
nr:hypothetical protein 15 [bacterium]